MAQKDFDALTITVSVDMLYQDVMFHFGNVEALKKHLEEFFDKNVADDVAGYIEKSKALATTFSLPKGTLVYMPKIPESAKDFAVLAHEIYHAVIKITKSVDIDYSIEGEEIYAYLTQYLTEEVTRELSARKFISFA